MKKNTTGPSPDDTNHASPETQDNEPYPQSRVIIDDQVTMTEVLVSIDRDWRYTYASSNVDHIFGRSTKDLIGKNLWEEFSASTDLPFKKNFEKAMNERVYIRMEDFYPPQNQWFEMRVWPTDSGITIFLQDITASKKAKHALKESEERYRNLVEQAVDGIFLGDSTGNFIGVNSKGVEMTGYPTEELLQMNMGQMFSEAEKQRTPLRYDLLKEGKVVINERMLSRKDGSLLAIEMHTKMMADGTYQSIFRDITERQKAQTQIRESEVHYRTIFENTGTATVLIEEDTIISLANSKFEELSGFSKSEVENKKSWKDFTFREDLALMAERHKKRRNGSEKIVREYEFRFVAKDGTIKNILLTIDLIPGTKKSVASLLNITARKTAEDQIRESEKRYRQLFENNPAPMLIYERYTLRMIAVNEAFLKHYGYKTAEVHSMVLTDLHPEEQKEALIEQAKHIRGHKNAGEWNHFKADGTMIDIIAVSHDIFFDEKDCRIAVINDITERKKTEIELRESEEKYRTVIECASDSIAIIKDGLVQYANQRLVAYSGYSEHELLGKPFLDFVAPESKPLIMQNYMKRLAGDNAAAGYEIVGVNKNGQNLASEVTASRFNYQGGMAELVFLHDITERKEIENKMLQINEELEERVQLRTQQLAKVNKELEKTNHTKDKFFSIIAHDLKNPVAVIFNSAEMLLRTLADHPEDQERLRRYSENILRGTQEGYKLLENLLEWANAQAGIMSNEPQNLDLTESIKECISGMKLILYNKNINILHPTESQFVYADKNMAEVILRNLLSNAIKYSHEGSTITIKMDRKENRLLTQIIDEGVGMTEETRVMLFRIENKSSSPGTQNERGTGLGLILCKEFIAKLGGSIWVESEVGKGSSFNFTLPLKAEDA